MILLALGQTLPPSSWPLAASLSPANDHFLSVVGTGAREMLVDARKRKTGQRSGQGQTGQTGNSRREGWHQDLREEENREEQRTGTAAPTGWKPDLVSGPAGSQLHSIS